MTSVGPQGSGSSVGEVTASLASTALSSGGSSGQGDAPGSGSGSGSGSAPSVGRGATRGRRERADEYFLRTRPEDLQSKRGEGGSEITVASNYFELIAKPNWRLLQYRVDMKPEIDHTGVRKALLYAHKEKLPKILFDGTMLFSTTRLSPDDKPLILVSERSTDQTKVEIKVRLVGEVQPTDYHYMQFFNIVLRQVGCVPSSLI